VLGAVLGDGGKGIAGDAGELDASGGDVVEEDLAWGKRADNVS
jgi:hypothetical protein